MKVANVNRSLITRNLLKGKEGMDKDREWARTYMMEATQTRQFKQ